MLGTAVRFGISVAASSFMLVFVANSFAAQDGIPNLVGTWKGHAIGGANFGELEHDEPSTEPQFKDRSMPWTLTVAKQDGRGLIGTWSSPKKSERLVGVISADNVTAYFVDEDT